MHSKSGVHDFIKSKKISTLFYYIANKQTAQDKTKNTLILENE